MSRIRLLLFCLSVFAAAARPACAEEHLWLDWVESYPISTNTSFQSFQRLRAFEGDSVMFGFEGEENPFPAVHFTAMRAGPAGELLWRVHHGQSTPLDAIDADDGRLLAVSASDGEFPIRENYSFYFLGPAGVAGTPKVFPGGNQIVGATFIRALEGGFVLAGMKNRAGDFKYDIDLFRLTASGEVTMNRTINIGEAAPFGPYLFEMVEGYLLAWSASRVVSQTEWLFDWVIARLTPDFQVAATQHYSLNASKAAMLPDGRLALLCWEQIFSGDYSYIQFVRVDGTLDGQSERFSPAHELALDEEGTLWVAGDTFNSARLPELIHLSAEGSILSRSVVQFWDGGHPSGGLQILPMKGGRVRAVSGYSTGPAPVLEFSTQQAAPRTPQVLINGDRRRSYAITNLASYNMTIVESDPSAQLFFNLDGTTNLSGAAAFPASRVATLQQSAVLRALAVDTNGVVHASEPVPVEFVPSYRVATELPKGGTVITEPAPPWGSGALEVQVSSNALFRITAVPDEGWTFVGWSGSVSGTDNPLTLSVRSNLNLAAVFGTRVSIAQSGNGAVASNARGEIVPFGTTLYLAAFPEPGFYFFRWTDDCCAAPSRRLAVTATNLSATAEFLPLPPGKVAITVIENGRGTVASENAAPLMSEGARVVLQAVPEGGSHFLGWSGDVNGSDPQIRVEMNASKRVIASFSDGNRLFYPRQVELRAVQTAGRGPRLQLFSPPGAQVRLEKSADLASWTEEGTYSLADGSLEFQLSENNSSFFRALLVNP